MRAFGIISGNLTLRRLAYKTGLRLAQIGFIRSAINDNADLSAFDHRPSYKIVLGVLLIVASNVVCWPVIAALGGISIYYRKPLIAVVGGPLIYGVCFFSCAAGITLSGGKHVRAITRWFLRRWVERLLSYGDGIVTTPTD